MGSIAQKHNPSTRPLRQIDHGQAIDNDRVAAAVRFGDERANLRMAVDTDIMQFFEMEPAKRFTIEEAKWDYMLYWRFATSVISRVRDLTIKQLR